NPNGAEYATMVHVAIAKCRERGPSWAALTFDGSWFRQATPGEVQAANRSNEEANEEGRPKKADPEEKLELQLQTARSEIQTLLAKADYSANEMETLLRKRKPPLRF